MAYGHTRRSRPAWLYKPCPFFSSLRGRQLFRGVFVIMRYTNTRLLYFSFFNKILSVMLWISSGFQMDLSRVRPFYFVEGCVHHFAFIFPKVLGGIKFAIRVSVCVTVCGTSPKLLNIFCWNSTHGGLYRARASILTQWTVHILVVIAPGEPKMWFFLGWHTLSFISFVRIAPAAGVRKMRVAYSFSRWRHNCTGRYCVSFALITDQLVILDFVHQLTMSKDWVSK